MQIGIGRDAGDGRYASRTSVHDIGIGIGPEIGYRLVGVAEAGGKHADRALAEEPHIAVCGIGFDRIKIIRREVAALVGIGILAMSRFDRVPCAVGAAEHRRAVVGGDPCIVPSIDIDIGHAERYVGRKGLSRYQSENGIDDRDPAVGGDPRPTIRIDVHPIRRRTRKGIRIGSDVVVGAVGKAVSEVDFHDPFVLYHKPNAVLADGDAVGVVHGKPVDAAIIGNQRRIEGAVYIERGHDERIRRGEVRNPNDIAIFIVSYCPANHYRWITGYAAQNAVRLVEELPASIGIAPQNTAAVGANPNRAGAIDGYRGCAPDCALHELHNRIVRLDRPIGVRCPFAVIVMDNPIFPRHDPCIAVGTEGDVGEAVAARGIWVNHANRVVDEHAESDLHAEIEPPVDRCFAVDRPMFIEPDRIEVVRPAHYEQA